MQLYLVITTYGEAICTWQYLSFIEMCGCLVTFLLDLELQACKLQPHLIFLDLDAHG